MGLSDEQRIKEAFLDMLSQACGEWDPGAYEGGKMVKQRQFLGYDSMCLSAYEDALALAVELGWIKAEEVIR
jgi:hypothetical protein